MPPTHGRPRDKGGTDLRNITAKEFESSNSTMNAFLGASPKFWMVGHQVMQNQPARHFNRRLDGNPTRPNNVANQTRDTLPGTQQAPASSQGDVDHRSNLVPPSEATPPSHSSNSPVTMSTIAGSNAISKNTEPIVDAVLPSPAPSDEPRQESVHVIDLEDETEQVGTEQVGADQVGTDQVGGNQVGANQVGADQMGADQVEVEHQPSDQPDGYIHREPSTSRLNELAEKYGGVDELEKRLRHTESRNTSPVSFSTDAPPEVGYNNSSIAARKRMQETESSSRKRVQQVQRFLPEQSLQSPITLGTPRVETASAAISEPTPPYAVASSFVGQITRRVELIGNQQGRSIEIPRLGLLQDACNYQDYFYLILHQLFCIGPKAPAVGHGPVLGLTSEHTGGLMLLTHLLLPNDQLNEDAIKWFSTFPLPVESLLTWSSLKVTYGSVLTCLSKLPEYWFQVRNHCQRRYYPPLVDEMIDTLGVHSVVLQRVISRAILRDIWQGLHDDCFLEGEGLFVKNQRDVQSRESSARTPHQLTQTKIVAYNQSLAIEYQRLWAKHQRHAHQQVRTQQITQQGGFRTQIVDMSMAPPHQIHSTIASSRNPVPSHGLSQPASNSSSPRPALALNINAQDNLQRSMNNLDRLRMVPSSPSSSTNLNPFSNGISPITPYASVSPLQRAATMPSDLRSPQQNHASSMVLGSNVPENALATPNYSHGMHQREISNTSRLPRHPFQSMEGFVEHPGLENLQPATGSPATNVAGRIASPQFSIQNMQLHRSATLPSHTQSAPPIPPGRSNPYLPATPNGPPPGINPTAPHYVNGSSGRASVPQQLLPPRGYVRQTTDPPNPGTSALHQAHARSPNFLSIDHSGKSGSMKGSFAFVKRLAVMPNRLDQKKSYFRWTFEVTKEDLDFFPQETESSDGAPPLRLVHSGSRLCRIRCVKISGDDVLSEGDWVVADTVWPSGVAMLLNGTALEIRKKVHHGKDLPVDVTKNLRRDANILSIATTQPRQDENFSYEVGLETIQITDSARIVNDVVKLQPPDALDRILKHSSSMDPEVQVVDASILLDLTDPYTSRIFNIPVRGRTCRHNQCFDLDVFLQTRGLKTSNHPATPESFKCPICGADARPQSLVMDLFFLKIRTELQVMNRADVKAVILGEQGNWKIKEEEEAVGESGDGSGRRASRANDTGAGKSSMPNDSEVIEIDD
ncbi:hypothetical protein MMC22_008043 [Lobaria immixta]|nr:hypothetical protein [Lobaria immixta]